MINKTSPIIGEYEYKSDEDNIKSKLQDVAAYRKELLLQIVELRDRIESTEEAVTFQEYIATNFEMISLNIDTILLSCEETNLKVDLLLSKLEKKS